MGQQRRRHDAQYKADVVLDILINGQSYGEASREYGIKDSVLSRWRQEFVERAAVVFERRVGARRGLRSWSGWWGAWRPSWRW